MKTQALKRQEVAFRIIKVGKTAVSVAVCGLMAVMSQGALAVTYDLNTSNTITANSTQNAIEVYDSVGGGSGNYTGNITINLASGVNLTGQTVVGSTPWAIFTSKQSSNPWVLFSSPNVTSSLTLNGNNQITGVVGWNVDYGASNAQQRDALDVIAINNSGNVFNNDVYANNINLNSGSTVQFLGNVSGTTSTSLNYQGSNSTVTMGTGVTLTGNVTNTGISNSALIFNGSGTITGSVGTSSTAVGTVQVNGNGSLVSVNGNLSTDHLDYRAASTVAVGGNLYLNVNTATDALNQVSFGNTNGTLQVGGNLVGVAGKAAVTTTVNNTGTVTMVSGTQTITGNIGANGLAIGTLNIGGAYQSGVTSSLDNNDAVSSTTTVNGDVFANTISLNNNDGVTSSELIMASGKNLTGTVVTENNTMGKLTLAGGVQTVTGAVGASGAALDTVTSGAAGATSTFTGAIYATNVNNSGTGTSTYQAGVTATNIGVNNGTSNFQGNVSATNTTIGTGTANFSADTNHTATASTNITFSSTGTANLNNGLTGAINYAGNNGTVNLADGKAISGAISTTTAGTGILNALGAATLSSDVGASSLAIGQLNVNTAGGTGSTVNANGNVFANTVSLNRSGELVMADTKNLTGNVTTAANGTGSLTLAGTSTVTGNVGSSSAALGTVNAGVTGKTATFTSGVVYANTLNYTGNGTAVFNGSSPVAATYANGSFSHANDLGFVGTVDFGTNTTSTGTFTLGNNVDLITAHAGSSLAGSSTAFKDANGATLRFAGSSVVTGDLGSSANTNNENFKDIYAGANGATVSFLNNVYVSSTTFHVSGTGTVNFMGDLNGPLVYDANGTVNVADNQKITGTVTTATNNTGTLNFVGSATTQAPIGTSSAMLQAVNFHAATSDSTVLPVTSTAATDNIGHNVYATTTTIGNVNSATTANITGNVFLGNSLTLAASNVTLNTAGAVYATAGISPVDFANTKNADGTLTNTATVTKSTTGTGAITTNGATLNFAIGTTAWTGNAGGTVNTATSSGITGGTGSSLVMNGSETVNLSLLGSLRNGQTYTLVDVTGGVVSGNTSVPGTLNDNSFVIDTALSRANGGSGDLVVTATRANDVYITKSNTSGHFSNPAALRLGTLAAAGSAYGQDMQTVLNKLDIDQWGFGNNQANLAVQAQRLAPIANNSLGLSAFRTASALTDSIGMRMQELRISETQQPYDNASIWIRTLNVQGKQAALGSYDGFKTKISGFTMGTDSHPNRDSIVGASLSYNDTRVEQQDFRLGDTAKLNGMHLSLYAAYDFSPELFVDGTLTMGRLNTVSNRSTVVGRVAQANFDSTQVTGKFDLGYRIKFDDSTTTLTPLVSLESSRLSQDAYQETGAGDVGLNVAQQTSNRSQSAIGLRLASTQMWGGMVVKPAMSVLATRDSGNWAQPINAQFIGDYTNAAAFSTQVASKSAYDLTGYRVNLGVELLMSKTSSLALRYDRVKNDSYSANAFDLMARWDF